MNMRHAANEPVMPGKSLPTGAITHTFRPSLFSTEQRFCLEHSSLRWSKGTREEEVSLSAIARVQIYHAPASGGRTIRRTVIALSDGRKLVVQSNHFVRLARFEDRVESYAAFVEALLARLQALHSTATILIGPPIGLWITYLLLLVAAAGVLLSGMVLWLIGSFPMSAAVSFGLLVGFLPLCWRVVRGGRARQVPLAQALDAVPD